jgi:hypothetical protein
MWERLAVLAFSALLVCGAPALAIYMIATHEAVGVEAVFLLLACLVVAGVGALCARFLF